MKTLITGASGFVGSAVSRTLLQAGHQVRVFVRPDSRLQNIKGLPVETVSGDLRDRSSLERALKGCRGLFHVAADYRLWVPFPREMYQINVIGTLNVMEAASRAGIERIVYTSSVATLGLHPDGRPATETTPSNLCDMIGHYKRSKFLAEERVRRLAEGGLPVVIVNPSTPVGPRDVKPTPTGRMILQAASGRMPAYVETGLNLVHVDDVAMGHLLAFEKGQRGERYILGGQDVSLREILHHLASITGHPEPHLRLPHTLVFPFAYVIEAWARVTGAKNPLLTVVGLRLAKKKMFFSIEKATRELGYHPRPVRLALEEAVQWFRHSGYLR